MWGRRHRCACPRVSRLGLVLWQRIEQEAVLGTVAVQTGCGRIRERRLVGTVRAQGYGHRSWKQASDRHRCGLQYTGWRCHSEAGTDAMSAHCSQGLRGFVEAWPRSLDRSSPTAHLSSLILLSCFPLNPLAPGLNPLPAVVAFMHWWLFASAVLVNLLFAAAPTLVSAAFSHWSASRRPI